MIEIEFSVSTLPYVWRLPLKEALRRIRSFGFDTIEIRASNPDAWARDISQHERRVLREFIESHGMRIGSLTPEWGDINLAGPNPGMRSESFTQVAAVVRNKSRDSRCPFAEEARLIAALQSLSDEHLCISREPLM